MSDSIRKHNNTSDLINCDYFIVYVTDAYTDELLDTMSPDFGNNMSNITKRFHSFEDFDNYFKFMLKFVGKIVGLDIDDVYETGFDSYNYKIWDYSIDIIIEDNNAKHYVYFFMSPVIEE